MRAFPSPLWGGVRGGGGAGGTAALYPAPPPPPAPPHKGEERRAIFTGRSSRTEKCEHASPQRGEGSTRASHLVGKPVPAAPLPPQCGGTSAPPGARRASPSLHHEGRASPKDIVMLRPSRLLAGLLAGLLPAALAAATPALAHPHVWITTRAELDYGPDGALRAIRHAWTFDPTYSAFAIQGLGQSPTGPINPAALAALARDNAENLAEQGYFTLLKVNGRKQDLGTATDPAMTFADGQLTLRFTVPLKAPWPAPPRSRSTTRPTSSPSASPRATTSRRSRAPRPAAAPPPTGRRRPRRRPPPPACRRRSSRR